MKLSLLGFTQPLIVFGPVIILGLVSPNSSAGAGCGGIEYIDDIIMFMGGMIVAGIWNLVYLFLFMGDALGEVRAASGVMRFVSVLGVGCSFLFLAIEVLVGILILAGMVAG